MLLCQQDQRQVQANAQDLQTFKTVIRDLFMGFLCN